MRDIVRDLLFAPTISQVEQRLFDCMERYGEGCAEWSQQLEVPTRFAKFWPDIVGIAKGGRAVAIECDGHPYHLDKHRDLCRDALILATGKVQAIYRIPAHLVGAWGDPVFLISRCEPEFFTEGIKEAMLGMATAFFAQDRHRCLRCWRQLLKATLNTPGVPEILKAADQSRTNSFLALVEHCRK